MVVVVVVVVGTFPLLRETFFRCSSSRFNRLAPSLPSCSYSLSLSLARSLAGSSSTRYIQRVLLLQLHDILLLLLLVLLFVDSRSRFIVLFFVYFSFFSHFSSFRFEFSLLNENFQLVCQRTSHGLYLSRRRCASLWCIFFSCVSILCHHYLFAIKIATVELCGHLLSKYI